MFRSGGKIPHMVEFLVVKGASESFIVKSWLAKLTLESLTAKSATPSTGLMP